ncbi:Fpg/Nei family DNA glycosylase [Cryobacterium melibiosiphilum]|uniref:DNA-(apurinic or apyrimidinic site) lyase n=1 Tax=Cryobacterium melibiosiphilum TaxID=995039 RepID=A0A3A5M799_9MICO|nr:DNA-formamidopyrimidine glycosylase family protein [Cryobacterium melibiosiphilum]RJT84608.1 Fpg/Nei family DNA glycosylase [Cryobacterium melibiosiphilum]
MPEGHSVHRIARQFQRNFVGSRVTVSSPQGRFAEGAAQLDGRVVTAAHAVGKQMFLEFDDGLWLRIHLGLYGAWDFAGEILMDLPEASVVDSAGENSLHSIGAPRRARLRMSEDEKVTDAPVVFPAEPVGQVRVRLLSETVVADLRGPTACEVLDPQQVETVIMRLGPDPELDNSEAARDRFTSVVRRKPTPIGRLLMDQSVVSGIGNVYRAEMLFRARLNPHTPGKAISLSAVHALWADWGFLLHIGIETGQMMTRDDLAGPELARAMKNRADRHWVYKREGLPCRVCGTHIVLEEMAARKLYWCPSCQA